MRTNVYVDGFNLDHRVVEGTPYLWLDFQKFFGLLLPKSTINRIRYFTSRVESREADPDQQQRQQTYIRALETIPNLTVHYGRFKTRRKRAALVNPPLKGLGR